MKKVCILVSLWSVLVIGTGVWAANPFLIVSMEEVLRGVQVYFPEIAEEYDRCYQQCDVRESTHDDTAELRVIGTSGNIHQVTYAFTMLPNLTPTNKAINNRNLGLLLQVLANTCPGWQEQQQWVIQCVREYLLTPKKTYGNNIILNEDTLDETKVTFLIDPDIQEWRIWIEATQ